MGALDFVELGQRLRTARDTLDAAVTKAVMAVIADIRRVQAESAHGSARAPIEVRARPALSPGEPPVLSPGDIGDPRLLLVVDRYQRKLCELDGAVAHELLAKRNRLPDRGDGISFPFPVDPEAREGEVSLKRTVCDELRAIDPASLSRADQRVRTLLLARNEADLSILEGTTGYRRAIDLSRWSLPFVVLVVRVGSS